MLLFALTITILISIVVFIVAGGLLVQKLTKNRRDASKARLDERYQRRLDPILLEDLPPESQDSGSLAFRQAVKRLCEPLLLEVNRLSLFSRRAHRSSLKRVMLQLGRELVGETLSRLTLAFRVFGFVEEEIRDLASRRWWIRAKAARNIALMRAEEATADLVLLLGDEEEDVRVEAALALVDISGVNALGSLLTNLRQISGWVAIRLSNVIIGMGSAGVPALVEGLSSDHPGIKGFCIDMLGEIGDIRACAPLIEFVQKSEPVFRAKALVTIGLLGDVSGKDILLEHLSSADEQLRISAAIGLGYLGSPETASSLKDHLLHDTIHVRLAAGNALKRIEGLGKDLLLEAHREADPIGKRVVLQFLEELHVPDGELDRIGQ